MRTSICPVLVVRPNSAPERHTILAALNIQSHKPEYKKLNDLIITRSQWMAKIQGADLQVVNRRNTSAPFGDSIIATIMMLSLAVCR